MTTLFSILSLAIAYAAFPVCMAAAAISDVTTFTIPNRLCMALTGAFCVAALLAGLGPHEVLTHLLAGGAALLLGFALFALGFLGGGDGKFLAASALWFGWPDSGSYAVSFALAGGVLALFILIIRKTTLPPAFLATRDWVTRLYDPRVGLPYGVALAAGALFVYPQSDLFLRLAGTH